VRQKRMLGMETAIPLLSLNPPAGHVRQNGRLRHETSNCRRRIVSDRNFPRVLVQTHVPNAVATWPVSVWAPGFFFCISMFLYVISGIICVTFAPGPTVVYGEHAVPEGATCLRVSRHADYVVAELGLGTPLRIMNLLVNLNSVRNATTLLLHSTRVSESSTVACTEDVCTDAMLMNFGGPNSPQSLAVGKFRYRNPMMRVSTASYTIGLDGEFSLGYGHDYFLTSTHICWEPYNIERVPETDSGLRMDIQSGELFANASDVIAYNGALSSPAMLKLREGCGNSTIPVSIFPEEASDEVRWLGLQNPDVYQTAPDDVDERRNVVETGTTCAQAAFPHAYSLFQLDCLESSVPCQTAPSVPFRRAATYQLRFAIPTSDSGSLPHLWTVQDSRLDDLPRLNDNAVNTAVIKLVLMILSALVIWVRANKVTASHSSLFMFCLRASRCLGAQDEESTRVDRLVIIEDAAIGLVAIAARFAVSIWRLVSLAEDNQLRAPLMQLLGCFFSFLHWIVRNFVLKHECEVCARAPAPTRKCAPAECLTSAHTRLSALPSRCLSPSWEARLQSSMQHPRS